MGEHTGIEWTDSTLNLVIGCKKVSRECLNCYMFRDSKRFGFDPTQIRITKVGDSPEKLTSRIYDLGEKVFVNSWSDTFYHSIPDYQLDMWFGKFELFDGTKGAGFPMHQFQILTKRPERAVEYFASRRVPSNCWIGTSIGVKDTLGRMDILRRVEAKIRFISFEPLLEDLGELDLDGISWVIIGGESDYHNPRPMKIEWAENIIKQAREQNVAVFFKQLGGKGSGGAGGCAINRREIKEFPKYNMVLA